MDLLICIATHNRPETVVKTVISLHKEYSSYNLNFKFICIDSSNSRNEILSNMPFVEYLHSPGTIWFAKLKLAYQISLDNIIPSQKKPFILWSPDDDLFLPTQDLANMLVSSHCDDSDYIIPSRYIFFMSNCNSSSQKRIWEGWKHHIHVASCSFSSLDRLQSFSSEGVASFWGFMNFKSFASLSNFVEKISCLLESFDPSFSVLIEDLSNVFLLSANWISIDHHPICLRGDDRRFGFSKEWKPSWIFNFMV